MPIKSENKDKYPKNWKQISEDIRFNRANNRCEEDLIIFRRQRSTKGQWMSHDLPRIKIEMPRGTFVVFKKVADLLKAGHRDAVMFAFNKKDKCAYIYKEEPEEDSYYLSNSGREYYRFTSKELMLFFIDFFGIEKEKAVYFDVDSTPNEKGMFKVVPSFSISHNEKQ